MLPEKPAAGTANVRKFFLFSSKESTKKIRFEMYNYEIKYDTSQDDGYCYLPTEKQTLEAVTLSVSERLPSTDNTTDGSDNVFQEHLKSENTSVNISSSKEIIIGEYMRWKLESAPANRCILSVFGLAKAIYEMEGVAETYNAQVDDGMVPCPNEEIFENLQNEYPTFYRHTGRKKTFWDFAFVQISTSILPGMLPQEDVKVGFDTFTATRYKKRCITVEAITPENSPGDGEHTGDSLDISGDYSTELGGGVKRVLIEANSSDTLSGIASGDGQVAGESNESTTMDGRDHKRSRLEGSASSGIASNGTPVPLIDNADLGRFQEDLYLNAAVRISGAGTSEERSKRQSSDAGVESPRRSKRQKSAVSYYDPDDDEIDNDDGKDFDYDDEELEEIDSASDESSDE